MIDDKKFVDNLQNFSSALESLVETLKEKLENDKSDVLETFLENFDSTKIITISENLLEIKNDVKSINKKLDDVLKANKASTNVKEKSMFENIAQTENKAQILDGLKIIGLIAGSVIAIGMAFKLIGDIDPTTVISLGLTIVALAYAYEKVISSGLTASEAATASAIMIIMSMGLTASSYFLSNIKEISQEKGFSAIFISTALGLSLFLISDHIEDINIKRDFFKFTTLMIIFPIMAAALTTSSIILNNIVPIGLQQGLSMLIIAGTMGISLYLMSMAFEKIKDLNVSKFLLLPLILPIMSLAIATSSFILSKMETFDLSKSLEILLTGAVISGLAIIMGTALWVLSKFKTSDLLEGSMALIIVATSLMLSSWIVSVGSYGNYPSLDWAAGVGVSLLAFGVSTLGLGLIMMATGGIGFAAMGLGVAAVAIVSAAIVAASYILNTGAYGNYPTLEWSLGVGLALVGFSAGMLALGTIMAIPFVGKFILNSGIEAITKITTAMVSASHILNTGAYGNYPTLGWSLGVGLALVGFSAGMLALGTIMSIPFVGKFILNSGIEAITKITTAMVSASYILNTGAYGNYPTLEWSLGVGTSLMMFASAFAQIKSAEGVMKLFGSGDLNDFILSSALSMKTANDIISSVDWKGSYPTLGWSLGVGTSLMMFASAFAQIKSAEGLFSIFGGGNINDFIVGAAKSMLSANSILGTGNWKGNYPSKEWSDGVANSIFLFANSFSLVNSGILKSSSDLYDFIVGTTNAMTNASISLTKGKWDKINLQNWSNDIINTIVSITDFMSSNKKAEKDIDNFVDIINEFANIKTRAISNIDKLAFSLNSLSVAMNSLNVEKLKNLGNVEIKKVVEVANSTAGMIGSNNETIGSKVEGQVSSMAQVEVNRMGELIDYVKNIDTNIGKMTKSMVGEESEGEDGETISKPEKVNKKSDKSPIKD